MPGKTSADKPCPVRVCPPPALWYNAVLLLWRNAVRRSAGARRWLPRRSITELRKGDKQVISLNEAPALIR